MSVISTPAALRWVLKNRGRQIPVSLRWGFEESGRWFVLVKIGLVGLSLILWTNVYRIQAVALGLPPNSWWRSCVLGFLSAALLVILRTQFRPSSLRSNSPRELHPMARGPLGAWMLILFAGGFVEEWWRALSLLAVQEAGFSAILGIIPTSAAFTYAHMSGIPARIPGRIEEILWELMVGVALASLFVATHTIVTPYVAGLAFNFANLLLIRRCIAPRPQAHDTAS
jgi:hypothetical protein